MRRRDNHTVAMSHSHNAIKVHPNLSRKQFSKILECLRRMYVHAIIQGFKSLIKVKYQSHSRFSDHKMVYSVGVYSIKSLIELST